LAVSSSLPGLMISIFVDGSIFKIKFFKLSAAEAPAALIKNSLSSLIFPSTIKIFKSSFKTIHQSYYVGTLFSYHSSVNFFGFPPVDGSAKAIFDNLSRSKSFSSITSDNL